MSDVVAEIFGYVILLTAVGLFAWETYIYRRVDPDVKWLATPGRFRRRIIMALLLICVGVLILLEAHGYLVLDNIRHLMIYVVSLTGLALVLFILSVRDLGDMARNAEKQAVDDLKFIVEEHQRQKAESATGSTE